MKKVTHFAIPAVRIVLGLLFFVFGLNGFLGFIPMAPPEGVAGQFMGGLAASGYFFPFLKGTEIVVGLMLLSGKLVPLALTVLAPIMINIVAFHLFLAPEGMVMGLVLGLMQLYLVWSYRDAFAGVLALNAKPSAKRLARHSPKPVPEALKGVS